MSNDWGGGILDAGGMELINRLATKRFPMSPALAAEADSYVLEKLAEDNWRRLKAGETKSNPKAYFVTTVKNLIEDFHREKFGRLRPPKWLKDKGEIWISFWTERCLERRSLAEISHRFKQKISVEEGWVRLAEKIVKRKIPNCGQTCFEAMSFEDVESIQNRDSSEDDQGHKDYEPDYSQPDQELSQYDQDYSDSMDSALTQLRDIPLKEGKSFGGAPDEIVRPLQKLLVSDFLSMLELILNTEPSTELADPDKPPLLDAELDRNFEKLATFSQELKLSSEERLILKMHVLDGISINKTAKLLVMSRHNVNKSKDVCLERIRIAFAAADLDFESLLRLRSY